MSSQTLEEEIKVNIVRPSVGPSRNRRIPIIPAFENPVHFYFFSLNDFENEVNSIIRLSLTEDNQLKRNANINLNIKGHRFSSKKYTEKECSICMQEYKNNQIVCKTHCDHLFHKKCLSEWIKYKSSCPLCREQLPIVEN